MSSRRSIRIRMESGTIAHVSICSVDGRPVHTRAAKVFVNYLSGDSIAFMTYLKLPVGKRLELHFDLQFHEWHFSLIGQLEAQIWKRDGNQYVYECALQPDSNIRKAIVRALEQTLQRMNPTAAFVHALYRRQETT
ncbi:hypothetical protein [Paenibacillus sp. CCS19]|uniref:hypothetical protein n=1 Tax=Paenibacillus sp. CCS19 TaxID=3158387 RepID=UPI00295E3C6B|nr:hypothetical protein [Paenibacillus cellulosilyticus]